MATWLLALFPPLVVGALSQLGTLFESEERGCDLFSDMIISSSWVSCMYESVYDNDSDGRKII